MNKRTISIAISVRMLTGLCLIALIMTACNSTSRMATGSSTSTARGTNTPTASDTSVPALNTPTDIATPPTDVPVTSTDTPVSATDTPIPATDTPVPLGTIISQGTLNLYFGYGKSEGFDFTNGTSNVYALVADYYCSYFQDVLSCNGKPMANFGNKDFDSVTLDDLASASYLDVATYLNHSTYLPDGIYGLITENGHYVKIKVITQKYVTYEDYIQSFQYVTYN